MRILITGGAGFIRSRLAENFHRHSAVRVLDDLSTGHRGNLAGLDVEFVHGSIRTWLHPRPSDSELGMQDVDYVYHRAAFVGARNPYMKDTEPNPFFGLDSSRDLVTIVGHQIVAFDFPSSDFRNLALTVSRRIYSH